VGSRDTSDEAAAVQREAMRRLGGAGRVKLAFELSESVREIAIAGILDRHPELSREEARLRVLRRLWGDELFEAVYGHRKA